jgi:diguanylate cyclase (GGDEF)-like protein
MRLTTVPGPVLRRISNRGQASAVAAIAAGIGCIFALDYATTDAPVQHLYYLPIIIAARRFGRVGGLVSAAVAVILYHLAKRPWLVVHYGEADLIQVVLFFVVGLMTAKLASDARQMHELAMTDDLTGLHNLRSFEATLASLVAAARENRSELSILVLDLDRLKQLNDIHGHLAGADAVRTVGHILANRLPLEAVACRYGGDEFVVAVPGCDAARVEELANGLRAAVNSLAPVLAGKDREAGTLSISIGAATGMWNASQSGSNLGERLFHAADQALYRAKAAGRNRVCPVVVDLSSQAP